MSKYPTKERRTAHRKEFYAPIKLTTKEDIILRGYVLNISYDGLKAEVMFKTTGNRPLKDETLSVKRVTLEIGRAEDKLYLKVPVEVKWSNYKYGEGETIYEAGFALKLNEEQRQKWRKFYDGLQ